ncbi:MAG: outer membrane protein assembly factor BamD [Comamonas sp.]
MSSTRLSMLRAGSLALVATLLFAGCATKTEDPTVGWSPNRIYSEAKEEFAAGNYEKAISYYDRLEGRAAGTPLAQQAQLDKAYAQYKNADKAQALATLDRFIRLHPASPAMDYALYLRGLVNFNDDLGMFSFISRQDLSERDQQAAKESYEAFQQLTTRFPESKYTPDATQRMTYVVNALAQYEVHVARYYYSRGAYVAAINRAQTAIAEYKEVPAIEEAVYILARSYDALGMTQLRDDTLRVLKQNYPNRNVNAIFERKTDDPWWKLW